jgi:hypothetical protein
MARNYNPRRVKIHRSYSVSEVEKLFDVHPHTVKRWIAIGLPLIEKRRPYLFHGTALRAFIAARKPVKRPLRAGEMYCVACRGARCPDGGFAEYRARSATGGTLVGLCPTCGREIFRRARRADLSAVCGPLDLILSEPERRLEDCENYPSNVDFAKDGQS